MMNSIQMKSINNLLFHCGNLVKRDRALILCDEETRPIAEAFVDVARKENQSIKLIEIPSLSNHGAEPPAYAADAMQVSTLIFSLCRYSLAHSKARVKAAANGARFLSLPLYDWKLLEDPSLHIDFKAQAGLVHKFSQAFTKGKRVHVTTEKGTDITLNITGRVGNYCPGFVERAGDLGSPPDIEANISPIEESSEGIVIIDGSITHPNFGLLTQSIELKVSKGRIIEFCGIDKEYISLLNAMFGPLDSPRRVLAECGVGLNPAAKLTGTMLTDEGALGCVHFGFGSNHTMGGKNQVDFHLDFVFHAATLKVNSQMLLKAGIPQL
ncbi:MAG TPA: hypothetical protein VJN02_11115 [Gammaproteobacteria bacterium]|nr:hypothetical protein [Gammaproteobacteria bacterium]